MIDLMKYTYMMEPEKISAELDRFWNEYQSILNNINSSWDDINRARAILYLTGQIYCEKLAVEAIQRRLHMLDEKLELLEFLDLVDKESERLVGLRKDSKFCVLEKFYRVVKKYKNLNVGGSYYLDEEKFIKKHSEKNPKKDLSMGYRGTWKKD